MSCLNSSLLGIPLDCGNVGGLKNVWIIATDDVTAVALGTGTSESALMTVTSVDLASAKVWAKYAFRKGNASFTATGTKDDKAGTFYVTTEASLTFNRQSLDNVTEIMKLSKGTFYAILEDNNGVKHFVGYDSYVAGGATANSGAEMAEANNYVVTLTSITDTFPKIYTGPDPVIV